MTAPQTLAEAMDDVVVIVKPLPDSDFKDTLLRALQWGWRLYFGFYWYLAVVICMLVMLLAIGGAAGWLVARNNADERLERLETKLEEMARNPQSPQSGPLSFEGPLSIDGDVTISGELLVSGVARFLDTATTNKMFVEDANDPTERVRLEISPKEVAYYKVGNGARLGGAKPGGEWTSP